MKTNKKMVVTLKAPKPKMVITLKRKPSVTPKQSRRTA